MVRQIEEDILRSLRRISRAIDLHSRKLVNDLGLTGPQLVVLRTIANVGPVTPSAVAREVSLSQATVTGIIDRLSGRQLVVRERSDRDRRLVTVRVTDAGQALVDQAPSPLQDRFVEHLAALPMPQQEQIRSALEQIVAMMGSEDLPAAPVLATSNSALSAEEAKHILTSVEGELVLEMIKRSKTPADSHH